MITIINKLINKISIILMIMMFLMPIITSILILTRSIFSIGSISVQELVMYFHATIFMLGIAYTLKHNRHVSIDIFYNSFSTKTKERIIKCGHLIFIIPFGVFLIYISSGMVFESWRLLEGSSEAGGLGYVFILKSLIPLCGVLIILQSFAILTKEFKGKVEDDC
tara:strand:- start:371 stop:865 length:495 start_codon:yes stop_codon:yes gene_type:complete